MILHFFKFLHEIYNFRDYLSEQYMEKKRTLLDTSSYTLINKKVYIQFNLLFMKYMYFFNLGHSNTKKRL